MGIKYKGVPGPDGHLVPRVETPEDRASRRLLWLTLVTAGLLFALASLGAYGAQTVWTQISPDGLWRVEITAATATTPRFELWSTSTVNGVRRKIGHTVPHDHDVFEALISSDSGRVAYRQGRTATGESHLYSTPIDRAAGAIISPPVALGGRVGQGIALTCGGMFVQYPYAEIQGGPEVTRVTHVAGGAAKCPLIFADGFESGNKGAWQ